MISNTSTEKRLLVDPLINIATCATTDHCKLFSLRDQKLNHSRSHRIKGTQQPTPKGLINDFFKMVIGQRINSESFRQETILQELTTKSEYNVPATQDQSKDTNSNPGKSLRSVILRADLESRLVIGLAASIKQLSTQPTDTLFCILITPKKGDSATHMQAVLLNSFCYENDIYILQVDDADKLCRLLNVSSCDSCVLVQRNMSQVNSQSEESLIDFCEQYWDAPIQPIVQLPEK